MKKSFLSLAVVIMLLCACESVSEGIVEEQADTPTVQPTVVPEYIIEEEIVIDERLITKEELFEYIQNNDVGLTVEDFDGVDVDDFIASDGYTPSTIHYIWKGSLEIYFELEEYDRREEYFAKTKISVDSTDEEYEEFIGKFFEAIDENGEYVNRFYGFDHFYLSGERSSYLFIAQSKNIEEFIFIERPGWDTDLLFVSLPIGADGAGLSGNLCYSRNGKFILLSSPHGDEYKYVEIFSELE